MTRKVLALSLLLFFSQLLLAQLPSPASPRTAMDESANFDRRIKEQAFEKWANDPKGDQRAQDAKQAEAVQEFYAKARAFVDLWQAFAFELNEKKTFNARLAKRISKAFHDLEKSEGWPVRRDK